MKGAGSSTAPEGQVRFAPSTTGAPPAKCASLANGTRLAQAALEDARESAALVCERDVLAVALRVVEATLAEERLRGAWQKVVLKGMRRGFGAANARLTDEGAQESLA